MIVQFCVFSTSIYSSNVIQESGYHEINLNSRVMAMASQKLLTGSRLLRTVSYRTIRPSIQIQWNRTVRNFATQSKPTSGTRMLLIGSGVGACIGTLIAGYEWYTMSNRPSIRGKQDVVQFYDKLPDVPIMRTIHNPEDRSDLNLVLFQFQTCPFCCKV